MKVIDRSDLRDEDGIISMPNRIKGMLNYGMSWYGEMQAQAELSEQLSKTLGNEHTLIRNLRIPGTSFIVSMILLSPQGVRVITPTTILGVFRAKGDTWQKFDSRRRQFKRDRPNPMIEASQIAEAVLKTIQEQGFALPEVEPVLMFMNPRTHVDQANPAIRIVQTDAIDHFAANLLKFEPIMDQEDISALTEALIHPKKPEPEIAVESEFPLPGLEGAPDVFDGSELDSLFAPEAEQAKSPALGAPWYARWGLSRRQWLLLAVMTFFEVLILIALVVMVVANTFYT
ncbi:MAG: hypothetical protein GTO14_19720 [Anaerolineales bacterium]|nr:hypothetical protein [Anaerolineales bacterium]